MARSQEFLDLLVELLDKVVERHSAVASLHVVFTVLALANIDRTTLLLFIADNQNVVEQRVLQNLLVKSLKKRRKKETKEVREERKEIKTKNEKDVDQTRSTKKFSLIK